MKALFLDRDGVINVDHGYVYRQEDFEFIDGIFDLCRYAKQLGFLIFVITNQSGIGRGYYTEEDFISLSEWMCGVFKTHGVEIDKVYYCPSHPDENSPDRKPMPGMILRAAQEFGVDLSESVLIGDKITDIQAGLMAGVGINVITRQIKGVNMALASTAAAIRGIGRSYRNRAEDQQNRAIGNDIALAAEASAKAAADEEAAVQKTQSSQREALKRKGRKASILTSPQGITEDKLGIPG